VRIEHIKFQTFPVKCISLEYLICHTENLSETGRPEICSFYFLKIGVFY